MSDRLPAEFAAFPPSLAGLYAFGPYRAICRHVVDGDTYDFLVDLGFNEYRYATVRLLGVNAPEVTGATKEAGLASKAYVMTVLPVGAPCVVRTVPDVTSVTLPDGRDLAGVLIAGGYAVAI